MSQTLNYVLGTDRRALVEDVQNFRIDFSGTKNWVQARQYEAGMRQVFVNIKHEDGTPLDLTGSNVYFEGWLPEHSTDDYRVIDNHGFVPIDPQSGKFRYDFPAQAFAIAGSYRQAFFRIVKDGKSVATLEFDLEVLADKVIGGLVPRDYISPLEDLLDQALQDFKDKSTSFDQILSDLKKQFADTIADLNKQGMQVTTLLTDLQSQIEALTEKEKQAGLFTQAEAQAIENTITQQLSDTETKLNEKINNFGAINVDESAISGGFVKDYFKPEIARVKSELQSGLFTFTQMNDTHWETITRVKPEAYRSLNHVKNALAFSDVSDLIVLNGDNTNSDTASLDGVKHDIQTLTNVFFDEVTDGKADRFIGLGNHDDGSTRREYQLNRFLAQDNYLHDAYFRKAYRTDQLLNGETRDNGSIYFYKDYPEKKIRFILINTNDIAEGVLDNSGSQKFDRWGTHTVRQEQMNWLYNVALANVPADYHVVVMGHTPLNANANGGWHDGIKNNDTIGYHNLTLVADLLCAFRDGSKVELNSTEANFPLNLEADFTKQGTRNLVGYFCGHTHQDEITTYNGLSIVEVACSVFYNNFKSRFVDTPSEDGFAIVQVDTVNRKAHIHGFGYSQSRSVSY
ncbi:BppU family phage baseplate upper protein [Lactobacillus sp. 3B(2020)]|uniref:BppU family phage baseplate upper protein n=1 Tax=Lactobacillus sp. 3B(2020) TaxID=2695882 RepID=UPI0015DE349D|nr:BppU family phage baseplate upper protein [Lactobacillus sp. 3B(2020)]QLL69797.1 BppU family phage baseplate upper protein [Lactobacillus sp. 3B(2020)]